MVAFYLVGGAPVYVFSLLLGAASTLGLAWSALQSAEKEVQSVVNAGLCALLGGLLVGRLGYVFINWGFYREHLWEVVRVYQGGFSWAGTAVGSVIGLAMCALAAQRSMGKLADALLPLGLVLVATAWLECWLDGRFYGWAMDTWWAIPARDEWGIIERRFPLQLIGVGLALAVFWSVERLRSHLPNPGVAALLVVLLISTEVFALSFLRLDPVLSWRSIHLESWTALAFAAIALVALVTIGLKTRSSQSLSAVRNG